MLRVVTREARLSPKKVAELGSTLRILSPSELDDISWGETSRRRCWAAPLWTLRGMSMPLRFGYAKNEWPEMKPLAASGAHVQVNEESPAVCRWWLVKLFTVCDWPPRVALTLHSMALHAVKLPQAWGCSKQLRIPDFVSRWKFSSRAERALHRLCWINSNATKKLMNPHQVGRIHARLLLKDATWQSWLSSALQFGTILHIAFT